MLLSETDVAWVAGLLEGEGYFGLRKTPNRALRITCDMSDLDIIQKLHRLCGGNISSTKIRRDRKPIYPWALTVREDVVALCKLIYPHMGLRRRETIDTMIQFDRLHPKLPPKKRVPTHGTLTQYSSYRCRCSECSDAARRHRAKRREKGNAKAGSENL